MSLTNEAFIRIREAIVSGGLEFGERLSEVQIATALGMSKAPVRAAFVELRDMGLVSIVPQAGTFVFSPTTEDVRVMSEFRAMLESEALAQSMKRRRRVVLGGLKIAVETMRKAVEDENWEGYRKADSEFHMVFMSESGNRYLPKAYNLTAKALEALRVRLQRGEGNFRQRSFDEHCEICALLENDQIAAATALLRHHILIINESLPTTLSVAKADTKLDRAGRDYASIFAEARTLLHK